MTNTEKLLTFIVNNPKCTFRDLLTFAIQDKAALTASLVELVETGQVDKQGFGHADAPYVYTVVTQ